MIEEPSRAAVDGLPGTTLLEFGAGWCPICQATRPLIDHLIRSMGDVRYLRLEDGKGKPLGRSFRVKLWPTLILLRDGVEVGRAVRPNHPSDLRHFLQS